jgi:hypothetical protein
VTRGKEPAGHTVYLLPLYCTACVGCWGAYCSRSTLTGACGSIGTLHLIHGTADKCSIPSMLRSAWYAAAPGVFLQL